MEQATFRCKTTDFHYICALNDQNRMWYARTTYPLKICLDPQFFMNVRGHLQAGDFIHLVRFDNDKWKQTLEICKDILVLAVDNDGVEIMQTEAIYSSAKPGEDGIVVDRGWAGKFVVRLDGATYATRQSVVEANEVATVLAAEMGRPAKLYESKKAA